MKISDGYLQTKVDHLKQNFDIFGVIKLLNNYCSASLF